MRRVDAQDLASEAERVRASGTLGRSGALRRLFDYLVETAAEDAGRSEIDIAAAVFDKPTDIDLAQDATVRVYVHRLRTKLTAFYAGEDGASFARLAIPRGQYRLVMQKTAAGDADLGGTIAGTVRARLWRWRAPILLAAAIAINLGLWAIVWPREPRDDLFAARHSQQWAPLIADTRPITIVIGDYYIFGELDPKRNTDRLIREYGINSPQDLDDYLMSNPNRVGQYRDLGLTYLPTGVANAMRDIVAVLVRGDDDRRRVRVVLASQFSPATLRFSDIVYIGYFSGLGLLRDPVFAGSNLTPGVTWDDLIDRATGKHFASNEGGPERANSRSRGYGYLARFMGPTGNHIRIIAGTRDMALMGMAEAATRAAPLAAIEDRLGGADDGEALVQVDGVNREVLGEHIAMAWRRAKQVWDAKGATDIYPEG